VVESTHHVSSTMTKAFLLEFPGTSGDPFIGSRNNLRSHYPYLAVKGTPYQDEIGLVCTEDVQYPADGLEHSVIKEDRSGPMSAACRAECAVREDRDETMVSEWSPRRAALVAKVDQDLVSQVRS
jgi:hypothetical protein